MTFAEALDKYAMASRSVGFADGQGDEGEMREKAQILRDARYLVETIYETETAALRREARELKRQLAMEKAAKEEHN